MKPKCEQSSNAILHDLKKNINPKLIQVTIERVKKIGQGGVVINTKTKEEAAKLQTELKGAGQVIGDYEVTLPKQRKPQIILYEVQPEIEKTELADLIVEHNEGITSEDFEILHSYKTRRGRNWILEMEPLLLEKLPYKKLKIGWQRVNFGEYARPTICFNCGQFGHIGKHCKRKACCMKIGQEGHLKSNCPKKVPSCRNCMEFNRRNRTNFEENHSCMDRKQRCWKKAVEAIMNRTDYGW